MHSLAYDSADCENTVKDPVADDSDGCRIFGLTTTNVTAFRKMFWAMGNVTAGTDATIVGSDEPLTESEMHLLRFAVLLYVSEHRPDM